jgi:hypothetical protein
MVFAFNKPRSIRAEAGERKKELFYFFAEKKRPICLLSMKNKRAAVISASKRDGDAASNLAGAPAPNTVSQRTTISPLSIGK